MKDSLFKHIISIILLIFYTAFHLIFLYNLFVNWTTVGFFDNETLKFYELMVVTDILLSIKFMEHSKKCIS